MPRTEATSAHPPGKEKKCYVRQRNKNSISHPPTENTSVCYIQENKRCTAFTNRTTSVGYTQEKNGVLYGGFFLWTFGVRKYMYVYACRYLCVYVYMHVFVYTKLYIKKRVLHTVAICGKRHTLSSYIYTIYVCVYVYIYINTYMYIYA